MPRLIVINGPPAAGKSTLARRWVETHPAALAIDVDVVREQLGDWRADPQAAGRAARDIAAATAASHLAEGHDVVVPQLLARPEFPDRLAALAGDGYVEVVLTLPRAESLRRYAQRWRDGVDPVHGQAPEPDLEEIGALYDRVLAFAAGRAHVAVPAGGTPEETWTALRLSVPPPS
ncbi:AAA family ATPase [Pseudonocardia sp. CA-107938]|uniref:AAA family ATPase n=1 Tax=Pseudonocardia sp. CA-107938 TaxID=3240021 RepID=UPI003D918177